MRAQRDHIAEILERRSRTLRRVNRYDQFNRRHDEIMTAVDLLARYASHEPVTRVELLKYIPIGIVACWEGYVRLLIRDLIDSGGPFRENSARLELGKFDVASVLAIGSKKVSLGELVAHQVRINNLDDINRSLSTVMGCDFLKVLRASRDPETDDYLCDIFDVLMSDVASIFEYRHIFCHELAVNTQPTIRSCRDAVGTSIVFTYHTELLAQQLLGGEASIAEG